MIRITSPLGTVTAAFDDRHLCQIVIGKQIKHDAGSNKMLEKQLNKELNDYFKDGRHRFNVPMQLQGTDFQKRVWTALCRIPVGTTVTYGQLAKQLNSSPRAIGNACRANPLPIIVPCHRVVSQQGLGGYDGKTSGQRLNIKRWLLQHEGVEFN